MASRIKVLSQRSLHEFDIVNLPLKIFAIFLRHRLMEEVSDRLTFMTLQSLIIPQLTCFRCYVPAKATQPPLTLSRSGKCLMLAKRVIKWNWVTPTEFITLSPLSGQRSRLSAWTQRKQWKIKLSLISFMWQVVLRGWKIKTVCSVEVAVMNIMHARKFKTFMRCRTRNLVLGESKKSEW